MSVILIKKTNKKKILNYTWNSLLKNVFLILKQRIIKNSNEKEKINFKHRL